MRYVKVENGIVVQVQTFEQEGFIEAPDNVVCGFEYDGNEFKQPVIELTEEEKAIKRIQELEALITPRRIREYERGKDNGWLDGVKAEIEDLEVNILGR